ncbi:hypothetical protein VTN00DRAFT_3096 [Thermoascus crustaceus]|uniref:uncharacterized protein n=1 Tax=Thermoascus crustaceus TaxID=5088 RepID=UPI0037448F7B
MNRWTPELDRQLLLVLIDQNAKHDWEKVSKAMGGFTAEACRNRSHLTLTPNTSPPTPTTCIYPSNPPSSTVLTTHPHVLYCFLHQSSCQRYHLIMVSWNTEQELKFLILILSTKEVKMSTDDWSIVASLMGPEFNGNGCRQHFAKLKKDALAMNSGANTDAGATSAPVTPKRKRANAANGENTETDKKKPRRRGKKADKDNAAVEDAADNHEEHSTTIKNEVDTE